jgi:thiol-disulfide isomerase/thioredoxin
MRPTVTRRRAIGRTASALATALGLLLSSMLLSGSALDTATPCAGTWWIEPAELRANEPLPEFGFASCDGEAQSVADYQGQPLLINFWATWCPPCVRELPGLAELHEEQGDAVALIGISVDDDPDYVRGFLERNPLPYTLAWDSDGIATDLGIRSIPVTLAVDAAGRLAGIHRGYASADDLERLVEKAQRPVEQMDNNDITNTNDADGGGESRRDGLEVEASE